MGREVHLSIYSSLFVCPAKFSNFLHMALTHFPLLVFLECGRFFSGDAVTGTFPVALFKPIT